MHWLPVPGIQSCSASRVFADLQTINDTQAMDPNIDEVQFFIVCEDWGKQFWSRSKAECHDALIIHALHEDDTLLPDSPITVLKGRSTSPKYAHTRAGTSPEMDSFDQEDNGDSGGQYCQFYDYGRFKLFCCCEAVTKHTEIRFMQELPSSTPSGFAAYATFSATVNPASPADFCHVCKLATLEIKAYSTTRHDD